MNDEVQEDSRDITLIAGGAGGGKVYALDKEEEAQRTQQIEIPADMPTIPRAIIQPTSVEGDIVHQVCMVVVRWMLQTGNADVVCKARKIKRHWRTEQAWIIEWGNTARFFELVAVALNNPESYNEMKRIAPSEGKSVDTILMLVDRAVESVEASRTVKTKQKRVVDISHYKKQTALKHRRQTS